MTESDRKRVQGEGRFAFGENWRSFVQTIGDANIASAKKSLRRLFPCLELRGATLLDVGCGAGLSMLAALQLGVREAVGIDIDPVSIEAAKELLSSKAPAASWTATTCNLFDFSAMTEATYDVVYSWGVLHHSGDVWAGLRTVCQLVRPGGHLAVALYRRTPFCPVWRAEKKIYSASSPRVQNAIRAAFKVLKVMRLRSIGLDPGEYKARYHQRRVMDWAHDLHDWLGGYPYESVEPAAVEAFLSVQGFKMVRTYIRPVVLRGALGSHNDEYVAVKSAGRHSTPAARAN